ARFQIFIKTRSYDAGETGELFLEKFDSGKHAGCKPGGITSRSYGDTHRARGWVQLRSNCGQGTFKGFTRIGVDLDARRLPNLQLCHAVLFHGNHNLHSRREESQSR